MNHLEQLKQKLMIKPVVQERENVAVVIKGDKKPRKLKLPTEKTDVEEGEQGEQGEQEEQVDEPKKIARPLIVDKTGEGFDRKTLLQKLAQSKKSKVTLKENVERITQVEPVPMPELAAKKAKKIVVEKPVILEGEEGEEEFILPTKKKVGFKMVDEEIAAPVAAPQEETIQIKVPKEKKRKTEKLKKGEAIIGAEVQLEIGDTEITKRLPVKSAPVNIKVASYIMNNRELFVNFINSLFEPYKRELEMNQEMISCDTIGKTTSDFSLLTHQKIVRDYMNLYTPYRGLLLYHGLGSGKTCTSIAIAEGMKGLKDILIMTPASLKANYVGELKKCGDLLYKKNQFWEWISIIDHPETLQTLSVVLNL